VKEIKFILAVSHNKFEVDEIEEAVGPFLKFVRLFNAKMWDTYYELFGCVAIVVTKAQKESDYYLNCVQDIIDYLKKESTTNGKVSHQR
jgi:hypothetical protein